MAGSLAGVLFTMRNRNRNHLRYLDRARQFIHWWTSGLHRANHDHRSNHGGTVFGTKGQASTGGNEGYGALVQEIDRFFESGTPPVSAEETIEIYAFMTAADESKQIGGKSVLLKEVIETAREKANKKLLELNLQEN